MRTFNLVLGIVEVSVLPLLLLVLFLLGYKAALVHWLIGGLFLGLGIDNIRRARNPKSLQ